MKLIATVGTNPNEAEYELDGKIYKGKYSFLALKEHFKIDGKSNVILLGSSQTKDILDKHKDEVGEFSFINLEDMAEKANKDEKELSTVLLSYLGIKENEEFILDITQGKRHHPIMMFLSVILSKTIKPKHIFYANVMDFALNKFKFESFENSLDASNLTILVDTYIANGGVATISYSSKEIEKIANLLSNLSNNLLFNQYIDAINSAIDLNNSIVQNKNTLFQNSLNNLKTDINKIIILRNEPEYLQLLGFCEYLKDKNLFSSSLQFLFESILSFLESYIKKVKPTFILDYTRNKKEKRVMIKEPYSDKRDCYYRRNAIKKGFYKKEYKYIFKKNHKQISDILSKTDKARNDIAHPNQDVKTININFISENLNKFKKVMEVKWCFY